MSGSSTSGGGVTPPYPSPSFQVIEHGHSDRESPSPTSEMEGRSTHLPPAAAAAGTTANYYASGNSLSNAAASPLVPSVIHNSEYMYAMDARDNMRELSNSASLDSVPFVDSQKRSYHPIEFMMNSGGGAGGGSGGNLIESLESGRLVRYPSGSVSASALGALTSAGHLSTGQNSFVATAEQLAMSPSLSRPITYGLSPADAPHNTTQTYPHPGGPGDAYGPSPPLMLPAPTVKAPGALSDSLPSIHGSVFSDVPKQLLPEIHSRHSNASTPTTVDKSPLEPSMTARGATPNRSAAPSLNMSRFPILPSPNSSVDTHRPTTPTPFSELPRGADGGRGSAFPTQRLPNPPERPPSHLLIESGLAESRRSTNDVSLLRGSARSSAGTTTLPSHPTSPVKATAAAAVYKTPLALLAGSSKSSSSSSSGVADSVRQQNSHSRSDPFSPPSAVVDVADVPPPPPAAQEQKTEKGRLLLSSGGEVAASTAAPGSVSLTAPNVPPPAPPLPLPTPVVTTSSEAAEVSPPAAEQPPRGEAPQTTRASAGSRTPSHASSSPSSSSSSSIPAATAAVDKPHQPSLPSAAAPDLVHFVPLIQQSDYFKSDIKEIACTGAFTMGDINLMTVKLRLLRHELLGRAEPIAAIQESAISAGRVRHTKPTLLTAVAASATAAKSVVGHDDTTVQTPPPPPRVVDVGDFKDTLVVFDNVLLAVSFSLWGSVAHYNDLVRGLLDYCAADVTRRADEAEEDEDDKKVAEKQASSALESSSAAAVTPPRTRLKIPLSSVMRFLNHCGVDVLIVSSNRKAASSFCAKRQQVRRRLRHDRPANPTEAAAADNSERGQKTSKQEAAATVTEKQDENDEAVNAATPAVPLRRVLVALSYDHREGLWCPLTTTRPVRATAAAWHRHRRLARQHSRRTERRQRRRDEAAAAEQKRKAAVQAQLAAWQQRMDTFCAVDNTASPVAGAAVPPASVVVVPGGPTTAAFNSGGGDVTTDGSTSPLQKGGTKLPFDGVYYPNLIQTDVGFTVLLKQGLHPLFGVTRLRLLVGVPLGVVVFLFGLAFIIYVTKTTEVCLFDTNTQACVSSSSGTETSSSSSSSSSSNSVGCSALLSGGAMDGYESSLPKRFLYGRPVSPGNCLIVTMCCAFAALVDNALITYFAVRYLALGGVRPCFHYLLQAAQVVLCAITCAFAAYVLFSFHERFHVMPCSALKAADAALCRARLQSCGGLYEYTAHTRLSGANVALALAIVYLVLCALQWLLSFLPAVPSAKQQDAIPTATPDTYAFRPSLFAPDGPSPQEIARLRQVMHAPLQHDLRRSVQQQDRLLTASTTIGEMMQANRIQSLKQMKLNEQRRQRRSRPFLAQGAGRSGRTAGKGGDGVDGGQRRQRRGRQRYLVWSDDEDDEEGYAVDHHHHHGARSNSSSSSTSSTRSNATSAARDRKVVLAPRLRQRVDEIGSKVRARAAHASATSNPFTANTPTTAAAPATVAEVRRAVSFRGAPAASQPTSETPRFATRGSSFRRSPSLLRKVVVVTDDKKSGDTGVATTRGTADVISAEDDDESAYSSTLDHDHTHARVSPSPSLTVETTVPMYAATFAPSSPEKRSTTEAAHSTAPFPPPPATSALTSKSSFARPSTAEGRQRSSTQSTHASQLPRPHSDGRASALSAGVDMEIDNIVSRLRGGGKA